MIPFSLISPIATYVKNLLRHQLSIFYLKHNALFRTTTSRRRSVRGPGQRHRHHHFDDHLHRHGCAEIRHSNVGREANPLGRLDHSFCAGKDVKRQRLAKDRKHSADSNLQLGTVIGSALDFTQVHYGFGRHQFYLTDDQLQEFTKYAYGEWIQTFATLMWTKISICLFLMLIPTSKALIRPLQGAVVFLILSNAILTLLWILQCRPVDAAWNTSIKGTCFSRGEKQRIIIAQASKSSERPIAR